MQNPVRLAVTKALKESRYIERKYGEHRTIIDRNKVIRAGARLRLHRVGIGWHTIG